MMDIRRAFFAAHARIRERATIKQEYADMATTCIAAAVKDNRLLFAHAGDCRAYLIHISSASQPTLSRLTTNQSQATELAHNDVILSEPMHSSLTLSILLRALGGSKLTAQQIGAVVRNNHPLEACSTLIRLANEAGGEDNISTVVISFRQYGSFIIANTQIWSTIRGMVTH
jgi:serine/threonine protein phosphatase PrpC